MEKQPKEFQIKDLLEITKDKKYAATVAAFKIVENFDKLNLDVKKLGWKTDKISVISMMALARGLINYDFVTEEQRLKLQEELKNLDNLHLRKAEAIFQKRKNIIDSEEDLPDEEVGEIFKEKMVASGDFEEDMEETEEYEEDNEDTYDEDNEE